MRHSHLEVASEIVKPKPESLQLGFSIHAWRKGAALPHLHPTTPCDVCADTVLFSPLARWETYQQQLKRPARC